MKRILFTLLMMGMVFVVKAQVTDLIHYSGTTLSDPTAHDGRLSPVVGVHNIQIMRANREHPSAANGNGWTYNHQPMMAYWKGKFYVHYLCDPSDEHVPPSHTLLQTSADGYHWSDPIILFPEYDVPEGYTKEGRTDAAHHLKAIMHQRVGFYVSKDGLLIAMGNYGVALDRKDDPNDGNGIGRVVREIKEDGTLGPIYFIYYNHGFNEKNTDFPNYRKASRGVRRACEEILANPLYRMQWVEEADRNDPLIPLNKEYKAFCYYTLPDGHKACLWKHALTSISNDGGNTWVQPVERAKGFVNSNAKIWGQRLSDGTYTTVYNPSEYRWPLGISLSSDGLNYTTLNLVSGEVPPMRYGGNYKSYGPQYVRGIQEGNGTPPDSDLWVTYSMNKEDIWVAHIPVPVQTIAHAHANDDFSNCHALSDLRQWNIYSPRMASVGLDGEWLTMHDEDPFDYCKVERKIPLSKELRVSFDIRAGQNANGLLQIEFLDEKGTACSRVELTEEGIIRCKGGARYGQMGKYEKEKVYHMEIRLSTSRRLAEVFIDGKKAGQRMLFAPVEAIERVMLRTGNRRTFPDIDTPADWYGTLENAGATDTPADYAIAHFRTQSMDADSVMSMLHYNDFKHYVDYFNGMEDENIVQAIPNDSAWSWMQENIPLFECPQKNFEEIYYYRWWTFRKHLERTPVGYAITEFLVPRTYADQYNLIASALGHHIHEARWLRNPIYLDEAIRTWYHGNDGKAMAKIGNFSSWTAASIYDRFLVDGRKEWAVSMLDDLTLEYDNWEKSHQLNNGLYWQADVQDAMEESISGGRRKKYMRPSINSYMYGNACAIAAISRLAGNEQQATLYDNKAVNLRRLVEDSLWNENHTFFETRRPDSLANVREAIGFIPWYFHLPESGKYDEAWLQVKDEKGFCAPRGLTTAERRHPAFRTHGVGKCEWDGAVWPFATSQTLTAMANYLNDYPNPVIDANVFFNEMEKFVQSHSHRGLPYIGEYHDEVTGYWLKGDQERSRYYNHSTFCDLIISGLVGLRPQEGNTIDVRPLIPKGKWPWWCLDGVRYHGHNITIYYDADGSHYHAGKGLNVIVN